MDSPPFRPKPIPSHLTNGSSPLSTNQEARDKKERDSLFSSIQTSNRGRQPVDFGDANGHAAKRASSANADGRNGHHMIHSEIDVEGYNEGTVAKTPLGTSRAQSPYTKQATIDFDGLSWPSTFARASPHAR
jgi:GTP cyclohydrolase I